jgi:hypothetical protein
VDLSLSLYFFFFFLSFSAGSDCSSAARILQDIYILMTHLYPESGIMDYVKNDFISYRQMSKNAGNKVAVAGAEVLQLMKYC